MIVADDLERGPRPVGERRRGPGRAASASSRAVGGDLRRRRRETAGRGRRGRGSCAESLDLVEAADELADRVRGVAVVEEQRDPPEQVVAGDQQAAVGLVQADVRGRVARRLDAPATGRGRSRPRPRGRARGRARRARTIPGLCAAPRLLVELERRRPARRSGGRPRSGGRAPRRGRRSSPARAPRRDASRARSRRGRGSAPRARSGRCGRGCRPRRRTSSSRNPTWASASSSWRWPSSVAIPVSKRTIPSPAADRERVHVRHPGPGKRQAQAPDAGQHPLAAAELAALPRAIARMLARRHTDRSAWPATPPPTRR